MSGALEETTDQLTQWVHLPPLKLSMKGTFSLALSLRQSLQNYLNVFVMCFEWVLADFLPKYIGESM